MRLLLIEDEVGLCDALVYILKKNNYGVDAAYDGISGQELAETGTHDLLIIDRMLPGKEGTAIIKDLRNQGISTPILILTARDSVKDRVEGLDSGADDYLIKPFSTDELLARIRALSRRSSQPIKPDNLKAGAAELDVMHGEIITKNDKVKLTVKEIQLLELLMRNRNQVITREQILDRVWGFDSDVDVNNIEIYIYYLRKKLNPEHCRFRIETIRGIGYSLKEDDINV